MARNGDQTADRRPISVKPLQTFQREFCFESVFKCNIPLRVLKPEPVLCPIPSYLRIHLDLTMTVALVEWNERNCVFVSLQGFGSGCAPGREWSFFFNICVFSRAHTRTHQRTPLSVKFWVITASGDQVKSRECCWVSNDPLRLLSGRGHQNSLGSL